MNKSLIVGVVIVILIFSGIGGWYFYSKKQPATPGANTQSNPTNTVNPQPLTVREPQTTKDTSQVTKDFKLQIQDSNELVLDDPVIVSQYAIQTWSDQNKGGQALLRYTQGQGWLLLTLGGGAWSVEDLTKIGVPKATAQQLLSTQK